MREHEQLRIKLLQTLLEWEEKLMAHSNDENHDYKPIRDGNLIENTPRQDGLRKPVFSVIELSDYLGVSADCIYTMVREHQIPFVRVRRRILFHRDVIDSWIQGKQ